jgi:hypothetical protein
MDFYKQTIELCKQEFGELVVDSEISQSKHEQVLHISIDARRDEEVTTMYPVFENGKLKVYESWSTALNLYIYNSNHAHFYYQGRVEENADGKKYVDPIDNDSYECDVETVFTFNVETPEEIVEWLRWIYEFRGSTMNDTDISFKRELINTSELFEEPFLFLPSASDQLLALKTALSSIPLSELPSMYDKAYLWAGASHPEYSADPGKYYKEIESLRKEGEEELNQVYKNYRELISDNNTLQPGDFILTIGSRNLIYTYFQYVMNSYDLKSLYYIVLRPKPGVSYAALYDYLKHQTEGLTFIENTLNPTLGMPTQIEFIPGITEQRAYVINKKFNINESFQLLKMISTIMTFEEGAKNMSDVRQMLITILNIEI